METNSAVIDIEKYDRLKECERIALYDKSAFYVELNSGRGTLYTDDEATLELKDIINENKSNIIKLKVEVKENVERIKESYEKDIESLKILLNTLDKEEVKIKNPFWKFW